MIIIQPALTLDKYFIYVYEGDNSDPVDAKVEIWDGDIMIESEDTGGDGNLEAWLNKDTRYRITATRYGKFQEWKDFPPRDTDRIKIRL